MIYQSYGIGPFSFGPLSGTLNLTETSPPQSFTEPLNLTEIKSYLHIPQRSPSDSDEDADLTAFIIAAREQAEILQNRDLTRKQYDLSLDYWPVCPIELRSPVSSVDLFRYRDSDGIYTTMVNGVDYIADLAKRPALVMPPYGTQFPSFTPWPSSAILLRFTAGPLPTDAFWSDAGARIKIGMRLLIASWYNQRLPFEKGVSAVAEYPYSVTSCLSYGAVPRVK